MGTSKITIQRISDLDGMVAFKEEWNSLLERNETKTAELTYEWQMTYWKYFNENAELFVLVAKEGDLVVGIAPMKLTRAQLAGVKFRRLEFIAGGESNYQDFIVGENKRAVLQSILAYLVQNSHAWDIISLRHVPEASATVQFILRKGEPWALRRLETEECIYLRIEGGWEGYARRTKEARDRVSYKMRKLQKRGVVRYFPSPDGVELGSTLSDLFRLHRDRWNQTETPSQFNEERYCKFYLEVVPQLVVKNEARLFVLAVEDSPVALLLAFHFGQSYLQQLTAYDMDYARCSPSLIVHELSIRQAFMDDTVAFDFGQYYPYKELWADQFKRRLNIEMYAKRVVPISVFLAVGAIHALRTNLRHIPALNRALKYTRRRIRILTVELELRDPSK